MNFHYTAYGINILSEIEFPALMNGNFDTQQEPISVRIGETPLLETNQFPIIKKTFANYSQNEYLLQLPEIAYFYISDGKTIIIEPKCTDWNLINLHFYANALTIALYQRNILLLHVSGIKTTDNKVLLLAAPRGTGKSTTAVRLHSKGYAIFSDDTVRVVLEDGKLFAYPSYPMIRMWEDSFQNQDVFKEKDKVKLVEGLNKSGFLFHETFISSKMEIGGIVFLEASGNTISVEKIIEKDYFLYLKQNFYRNHWIANLKKQTIQFKIIEHFISKIPAWKAIRPLKGNSEKEFSEKIIEIVLT